MTRKMKDSGIEWIDEIPEEWTVRNFKHVFSLKKGLSITKENLVERGIKVISYGQIHSKYNSGVCLNDYLIRYVGEQYLESDGQCLVSKNDFIFADTSEDLDGVGNCVYIDSEEKIFAGYHTIIASPLNMYDSKYFAYLYKTDCWRSQLRSRVSGIKLFSITQKILKQATVIIPSEEGQYKIVKYLDERCNKIDQTIEKEKEVIEKLKEYKQSVITEAVTKGLNPDVPMKDSGVEWIGEIPEHWEVKRIKNILIFNPTYSENLSDEDNVSFIPMECLKNDRIEPKVEKLSKVKGGYTYFANGDVIMAKVTPCFENGNIAMAKDLTNGIGFGSSELYVFRCNKSYNRYVFYYLQNIVFKQKCVSTMYGTGGLKRVSSNVVFNYKLAIPNNNEQKEIADYLDKKCSAIDKLITNKEKVIEKLTEYKKSLIYECVTGKREIIGE